LVQKQKNKLGVCVSNVAYMGRPDHGGGSDQAKGGRGVQSKEAKEMGRNSAEKLREKGISMILVRGLERFSDLAACLARGFCYAAVLMGLLWSPGAALLAQKRLSWTLIREPMTRWL
jgi:hypothetical protein